MMHIQKTDRNITFNAGLTNQMKTEIASCKPKQIEKYMKNIGIKADFKHNKVVAWSSLKCCEFVQELNKKYKLNLSLPNGIIIEDFQKLYGSNEYDMGLTNFTPAYLYKTKNVIVPEKTIFFNSQNVDWRKIDSLSDELYANGVTGTDFFLESFLHEFMHVIHLDNLLRKIGIQKLYVCLTKSQSSKFLKAFQEQNGRTLSQICHYAASNPFESVACDLAKSGIKVLDKDCLIPQKNIFNRPPYKKRAYFLIPNKESKKDKIIRNLWNGKF